MTATHHELIFDRTLPLTIDYLRHVQATLALIDVHHARRYWLANRVLLLLARCLRHELILLHRYIIDLHQDGSLVAQRFDGVLVDNEERRSKRCGISSDVARGLLGTPQLCSPTAVCTCAGSTNGRHKLRRDKVTCSSAHRSRQKARQGAIDATEIDSEAS